MTQFTACILKPRGPFHAGEREGMREGSEVFIHSDTLFSAFCHSFLLLYGRPELERLLSALQTEDRERLPVVFSSAFPYYGGKFYFPVPRSFMPQNKDDKRVRFVEQPVFEALLAGNLPKDKDINKPILPAFPKDAIETADVPKVTISRLSGTAQEEGGFYHVGLTYLAQDAALFFLMRVADDWRNKVEAAIRLACDEGIGGYRSIGKGQFAQPEMREISLHAEGEASVMLSLYYPAETETAGLDRGWYELIRRKGYVYSPETRSLRRKTVTMFAEGSVFPDNNRRGKLVDVTPENAANLGLSHRIYRSGLAFLLPCKGGKDV